MLSDRQNSILELLRAHGSVQVDDLSSAFAVTTQTIRRDLSELCDLGLAMRIHGGARRATTTSTLDYEDRRNLETGSKHNIAQSAAQLIENGASVSINIGTTTEQVAAALKYHKDLTVITNNVNVVQILRGTRLKSLNIAGGEIRPSDGAIIGTEATEAFQNSKVDVAIIGASSMDDDGSILDFDQREVAVARSILANARMKILVCDQSKFGVSAPHRICQIGDLDVLITDKDVPPAFQKAADASNTNIIVASPPK